MSGNNAAALILGLSLVCLLLSVYAICLDHWLTKQTALALEA